MVCFTNSTICCGAGACQCHSGLQTWPCCHTLPFSTCAVPRQASHPAERTVIQGDDSGAVIKWQESTGPPMSEHRFSKPSTHLNPNHLPSRPQTCVFWIPNILHADPKPTLSKPQALSTEISSTPCQESHLDKIHTVHLHTNQTANTTNKSTSDHQQAPNGEA